MLQSQQSQQIEINKCIVRWLVAANRYSELLTLHALNWNWHHIVHQEMNQVLKGAIYPKRAFITMDTCMCCWEHFSLGVAAKTPYDEYLTFCRRKVRCCLAAMVYWTDHTLNKVIEVDGLDDVSVTIKRTSGVISPNWSVKRMQWSVSTKQLAFRVSQSHIGVKDVLVDELVSLNPHLKEVPLTIEWTTFHNREWREYVIRTLETYGLTVQHLYSSCPPFQYYTTDRRIAG